MAVDERYTDNVVLKKSALQNLLTNIRNYPIVDVDFMEEADVDEAYGDNVWENYTQNTPCIKITYGDPDTTKGNIIFHADNRAKIAQAKKEIVRLKAILAQWNYYKNRWTQIKANSKAEKEKKVQEIAVLTSSFNSLVNNTKTFLTVVYPALRANFVSQFNTDTFNQNINASDGSLSESTQVFTRETISQTIDNETYSLTFELLTPYARTWIVSALNQVANALSYAGATSEAAIIQDFKEFVLQYNDIIIDEVYNSSNVQFVFEEIDTSTTPYQEGTVYFTMAQGRPGEYNYMPVTESTIADWANIPNVYILTNANRLEEFIGKGTTNLNKQQVLSSVSSQIETIMNEIIDLLDAQITTADTHLQHLTQDIVWFTTTDYNDGSIDDYGSRTIEDAHTFAYTNGGAAAELYSIADLEACISYWQNQINNVALDSEGHPLMYGYKYVKVGDHIDFSSNTAASVTAISASATQIPAQEYGTFRADINGTTYEIGIKGLEKSSTTQITLAAGTASNITMGESGTATTPTTVIVVPGSNSDSQLGSEDIPWNRIYTESVLPTTASTTASLGNKNEPWPYAYINNLTDDDGIIAVGNPDITENGNTTTGSAVLIPTNTNNSSLGSSTTPWYAIYTHLTLPPNNDTSATLGSSTQVWSKAYIDEITINTSENNATPNYENLKTYIDSKIGDATDYTKPLIITNNNNGTTGTYAGNDTTGSSAASIRTNGGIYAAQNIWAAKVFNAVFNDYAEYRTTIDLEPGHVVVDNDDGSLSCATKRLQPGAQVISDTFGHAMGGTSECQTPLAVAGRVLVYPYQARESYHAGMAVCSAPNGTVDIMTREEIKEYPDCIVGIVSEIPQYETWGSDNVNVNGRIWIKIK